MIKRLRNRFIRIAMLSVTAVMLLLTIILNVANYVSTDSDLKQTLTLIYENAGTIPHSRFLPPSGSDSAVTGSSLAANGAINASDARSASPDNIPGIGGLPAVLASAGGIARAGGNSSGGIPAGGLSALLGDKQSSADRERLLIALRPYLSDSRSSMLDTVLRLMRLARLGDIGKLIGKL